MRSELSYNMHRNFLVFQNVLSILPMLLKHFLIVCFLYHCYYFISVRSNILLDLLQQKDIIFKFLLFVINAFNARFLLTIQFFKILLYALFDCGFDLLIVTFERKFFLMIDGLNALRSQLLAIQFIQKLVQFFLLVVNVSQKLIELCFTLFVGLCSAVCELFNLWREHSHLILFFSFLMKVFVKFLLLELNPYNFTSFFHDLYSTDRTVMSSIVNHFVSRLLYLIYTCFGQARHLPYPTITSFWKSLTKLLILMFGLISIVG